AEGTTAREIVLARNQHVDGFVLTLAAGRSIRGVVSGLRTEDLQKVHVVVRRQQEIFGAEQDSGVDERGAYIVRNVRAGPIYLVAELSMRRQLQKTIEMPADADVTVNL